jgi:DNA polymerase elongation subunit (family B)
MQIDNSLIFGKNPTERIVSLESNNDCMELFIQDENGEVISKEIPNRFWLVCNEDLGGFKRLKGESHYKWGKQFTNKRDLYAFKNHYIQKDIFVIYDNKESSMVLKGLTYYKGLKPKDISILSFDIETIGLFHDQNAKILLISNTFRKNGIITKKLFAYDDYADEADMLSNWCKWVCKMDPSILIGHNINGFDLHYIKFIADKYFVDLKLGRNESIMTVKHKESKKRVDGSRDIHYFKSHIYGREIVDTMFLSINHDMATKKYISYGLKQIIKQEGLEKANRVFYDASKIRFNYKDPIEWEKIKEYCKDDSDDALALFDLMVPAQFYLANSIPKSFQALTESATGSQLNSFLLRSYIQFGHSIPKASALEKVKGGISFGIPGIYSNVIKIDLKSAYPSQVLRFKLYDPIKDPEANFYKMVHHFTYERFDLKEQYEKTKDPYYLAREQAGKIVINSAYGLMNTPGLNFNNSTIANKITKETRDMIESSLIWASDKDMTFYKQYMKEEEENDSTF